MKINNLTETNAAYAPSTTRATGNTGQPVAAGAPSSSVTLSSLSSRVAGIESGLKDVTAPFDAAKVAAIKSRIEDGSYRIDAGRIADAMIAQLAQSASPKVS